MTPAYKFISIIFLKFLLSGVMSVHGQSGSEFRAVEWGLQDGLSQAETYHMLKDVKGFLWIATRNGLNRFDGYTFRTFKNDRNNNNSLPGNNTMFGLKEDSLHNIWIGTEKGLSRYDIKADTFTRFIADPSKSSYGIKSIHPFSATKDEILCIESERLITAYNIRTFAKKVLADLAPYERQFPGPSAAYSIYDSRTNCVWMNYYDQQKVESGLLKISLGNGAKKTYLMPLSKIPGWAGAEAICFDARKNLIWINSYEGLLKFSLSSEKFERIPVLQKYEKLPGYDRFVGITQSSDGNIWLATKPKGILVYNPGDQTVELPFKNDPTMQQQVSEFNACLYSDRDGIIWSGYWLRKGINQIIPFSPAVKSFTADLSKKNSLSSNFTVSVKPADKGKIWLGTDNGLNILDLSTELFEVLTWKDLSGLPSTNEIHVIKIDTITHKAWLKAQDDVYVMDMKSRRCRKMIIKDSMDKIIGGNFNLIPSITSGGISAGIINGNLIISRVIADTIFKQELIFPEGVLNPYSTTITNNHLFFRDLKDSANYSYAKHNGKWKMIHTSLDSIHWKEIFFDDKDSGYWVAGERRLIHYDKNFAVIQKYSPSDGLPEIEISGLIADRKGNIWFHTEWSVHQLNIKTGQILSLAEKDGFDKQDFTLMPFTTIDQSGNIYYTKGIFGKGFIKIDPENYSSRPSSVYFQSLQINQSAYPLPIGINNISELSLTYDQQKIEIETGIIDFFARGKSRIRYKLDGPGHAETWIYGPYYSTIRYDGIKPGQYKLTVQASNAANEFIGPEKNLLISISPPFWETWWFRILSILGIVSLLFGIIQFRSRNLKKQNQLLEDNVVLRTTQLKKSLEELKETQTQLIHSEKMASLGELTAGIAHEIQNPLNFVNNFSDVNTELAGELKDQVNRLSISEVEKTSISSIIEDIERNEQKINQHGKRADAIVKSMLQHSRTGSGQKAPTNLNALAEEYLRLSYHGFRAKEKTFHAILNTSFDDNIGMVTIIPQDIGRVMLNLYNNAYYTTMEKQVQEGEAFEPKILVKSFYKDGNIFITVKDNGKGIPEKVKEKIFQPFFTTKPTGQGTGLGLSLSYDIIKAHGGKLKVDSREGEWTEFTIQLPG